MSGSVWMFSDQIDDEDKCIGTNRGFHNVAVDLFLPVDVPSPWD